MCFFQAFLCFIPFCVCKTVKHEKIHFKKSAALYTAMHDELKLCQQDYINFCDLYFIFR